MPVTAAERQARCRRRLDAGIVPVTVDVHWQLLDRLITLGLLAAADVSDKRAIGAAVTRFLRKMQ